MGLRSWLGDRLPVSGQQFRELTNEPVPYHLKRWWFALGGTPAYLFIVQIFTGILLAFYYEASPTTAYESVEYITNEVSFGWYIRSVHKWAATLMIVAVILHQIRVFFTGAYRKPREINWIVGMCLLFATLMTGLRRFHLEKGRRITFEYVLISGFNDSVADARMVADLVRDVPSKINVIPLNEDKDHFPELCRPRAETVDNFAAALRDAGLTVTVRWSRGSDVAAACGQLRGRQSPASP